MSIAGEILRGLVRTGVQAGGIILKQGIIAGKATGKGTIKATVTIVKEAVKKSSGN